MQYMLDTNMCIYLIKKKPVEVLLRYREELARGICVSAITLSELEYGVQKSSRPLVNALNLVRFLAGLDVLPFDDAAAREYGLLRASLERAGRPIGGMDMLIGAHAMAEKCVLVTNNEREFLCIEGLKIENWAKQH